MTLAQSSSVPASAVTGLSSTCPSWLKAFPNYEAEHYEADSVIGAVDQLRQLGILQQAGRVDHLVAAQTHIEAAPMASAPLCR